jgi:predicted pyridoxine 5'-phosphate oxidase superfamily flavin-nucleotide-binding protein
VTETLRVAGRIAKVGANELMLDIKECFVHCGKALIRSQFWQPPPQATHGDLPAAARFCILGTADADGNTDASPKGDPAGFLIKLADKTFALPDRTGNRLAYGHRNIIAHDRVTLVAFAPGATQAFELTGRARLTKDATLLSPMSVEGKAPLLATLIAVDEERAYDSQALRRARIWDADRMSATSARTRQPRSPRTSS